MRLEARLRPSGTQPTAPGRQRRINAETEKAQAGLGGDRPCQAQAGEIQQRRQHIRRAQESTCFPGGNMGQTPETFPTIVNWLKNQLS